MLGAVATLRITDYATSKAFLNMTVTIRPEETRDVDAVRRVNQRAFDGPDEAALVEALRGSAGAISLVAAVESHVVGHILFTPVQIEEAAATMSAVGLGPMAVLPGYQRQGIGSRLVHAGLDACRALGIDAVVVVGHPAYYPRFGFVPAIAHRLEYEHPVSQEAFMVLELRPGALAGSRGVVRYRPEFSRV